MELINNEKYSNCAHNYYSWQLGNVVGIVKLQIFVHISCTNGVCSILNCVCGQIQTTEQNLKECPLCNERLMYSETQFFFHYLLSYYVVTFQFI